MIITLDELTPAVLNKAIGRYYKEYESKSKTCLRWPHGWLFNIQPHNATTVEITWLAVHAEWRGRGIRKQLIAHMRQEMQTRGYRLLLVATLAPSYDEGPIEDGYAVTRAFCLSAKFLCIGKGSDPPCCWSCLSKSMIFSSPPNSLITKSGSNPG